MNITTEIFVVVSFILFPFTCFGAPEKIVTTTVCDVASNPAAFNHKLIKLSAAVIHDFRQLTIATDDCKPNLSSIWLEYGGLVKEPSIFNPEDIDAPRSEPPVVEDISIPLVDDPLFRKFDKMIAGMSSERRVRVTLIGRYFAGHQAQSSEFKFWNGYGRLGCCTLLVVQQIVEIKTDKHK